MKLLLLLLLSVASQAKPRPCDPLVTAVPKYKTALEWLKPYNGRFKLGNCEIELHTCDPSDTKEGVGDWVGDVLITDSSGKENYVPLHFTVGKAGKFAERILESRTMFNYYQVDTIRDPVAGAREEYRLEILKKWRGEELGQITMGTYNTKRDLIHLDRYTYRWSECF
jgi:hypothetical protein